MATVVTLAAIPFAVPAGALPSGYLRPGALPSGYLRPGALPSGYLRVNQIGYGIGERKVGYLLATADCAGADFRIADRSGATVLTGRVGASRGGWNDTYRAVCPIDLSALNASGTYRLAVSGPVTATSPSFRVARPDQVYAPLVGKMTRFFQAQRDGADVVRSVLSRRPAHLADAAASVSAVPRFDGRGRVSQPPRRIGGPVDVSGGWFDAGDYLKFTMTTAYAVTNLLLAYRAGAGQTDPGLMAEIDHGIAWLDKMWDDSSGVLYAQVGFGSGTGAVLGDHDVWRLPEADDARAVSPGEPGYFLKYRPVFPANAAGSPISPNLAGRVAAAFALAAQVHAWRDPARAGGELRKAAALYALADTGGDAPLVTTYPRRYYPENSWTDDMEFGAVELALAARALGDPRAAFWLAEAGRWARAYLDGDRDDGDRDDGGRDSLNLYDVGTLAHLDLAPSLSRMPRSAAPSVEAAELFADVRSHLVRAEGLARRDRFGAGIRYDGGDPTAHAFGLVITAMRYRGLSGDESFTGFAREQAGWVLGANPWGTSLVIGVGTSYPRCPQHQMANLTGDVLAGGVVNGPDAEAAFGRREHLDGARPCRGSGVDGFEAFTGNGARFVDDVAAWQSVEPAIDMTSTGLLAFTLLAGGSGQWATGSSSARRYQ